tara:strand:+ start:32 stop:310 length:279 start_codon:yes stop_codon:yes gene_type:complete
MSLEKEKTEIPCPGGGNAIKTTYGQLASKSKLKSNKGHEYHFKNSDQSKLKNAMKKMEQLQKKFTKDMENAQEDFGDALNNVIGNADIMLKR